MEFKDYKESTKRERILKGFSILLYVLALLVIGLAYLFPTAINPVLVFILLAGFVVINLLGPFILEKSWKSFGATLLVVYFCLTFLLGVFRPNLNKMVFITVNSILGWLFIITIIVGMVLGIRRKFKR